MTRLHDTVAIRADQDSALIFVVHLRTFDVPGATDLLRLTHRVYVSLEDERFDWAWLIL